MASSSTTWPFDPAPSAIPRTRLHDRWHRAVQAARLEQDRSGRLIARSQAIAREHAERCAVQDLRWIEAALDEKARRTPEASMRRSLRRAERSTPSQLVSRLLHSCVALFDATTAGLTLILDGEHCGALVSSSPSYLEVDDLHFAFGEGPSIDAARDGQPVLVADLGCAGTPWPAFTPAALALDVRAVFAIPLALPGTSAHVLVMYRVAAGDLAPAGAREQADGATDLARRCLIDLVESIPPGSLPETLDRTFEQRAVVHQATGRVAAHTGFDPATALRLLRARAWSDGSSIYALAADVVAGSARLDHDG